MNAEQVARFVFAGNATFTIESLKSMTHYTFKVDQARGKEHIYWVTMLTAPDTFTYMGMIERSKERVMYRTTRKTSNPKASVHVVLSWFITRLTRGLLHEKLVFRHAGRCGRCGRELTTPESIDTGLGPVCADKLGVSHERAA